MIHLIVLATALLHMQDPAGDAVGDGTLVPPTAPVYANTADFDLQSVSLMDDPKLTVRVTLGSISNAGHLPNGFSSPIIEVYLDTGPGGSSALLPGSGMSMPPKHGWNVAIRATGDQVYAVTPQAHGGPVSWPHLPASVEVQGNALVIHTDLPRPAHADIYALTGVYDPFTSDAWRPLTTSVSPWAFSSDKQQAPVVDLLANGQRVQRRAIDSRTLVPYRPRTHGLGWLLLMVLGVIIAAAGTMLRRRVPLVRRPLALPPPQEREEKHRLPPFWGGMPPIERSFFDEVEDANLWPETFSRARRPEADPVARLDDVGSEAGPPLPADEPAAEDGARTSVDQAAGDDSASSREEEPVPGVEAAGGDGAAADEAVAGDDDVVPEAEARDVAGDGGEVPLEAAAADGATGEAEVASDDVPPSGVEAAGGDGAAPDEAVAGDDDVVPEAEARDVAGDDSEATADEDRTPERDS